MDIIIVMLGREWTVDLSCDELFLFLHVDAFRASTPLTWAVLMTLSRLVESDLHHLYTCPFTSIQID